MHPVIPSADGSMVPFELELMENANRYQRWLMDLVFPFLGRSVLEVGAGIGNMSRHFPPIEKLVLSDIDEFLARELATRVAPAAGRRIEVLARGERFASRFASENFDTVVSFNVLEHVADDVALVADLLAMLKASGAPGNKRLITLVPAHQWAFGEVDKAFGHKRRYTAQTFRKLLRAAGATDLSRQHFRYRYVNLVGLFGWWLNGNLLGRGRIGKWNVKLFEMLCPVIRPSEELVRRTLPFPMGNSLLAVYKL